MDKDGEKKQLEDARAIITGYQTHAISVEFEREEKDRERVLLDTICSVPVVNLESFFAHFTAVGELQGIRRRAAMLPAKLEEIQGKLEEL